MNTQTFVDLSLPHYVACALWLSTDENDEPLDVYTTDDIAPETLTIMQSDLDDFITSNWTIIVESGLSPSNVGHDFWLTRNRHGTGFWDRGLGKIGESLSSASKVYGEMYLIVCDDGFIR